MAWMERVVGLRRCVVASRPKQRAALRMPRRHLGLEISVFETLQRVLRSAVAAMSKRRRGGYLGGSTVVHGSIALARKRTKEHNAKVQLERDRLAAETAGL